MILKKTGNNRRKSISGQISKVLFLFGFSLFIAAGASAQDPPSDQLTEVDVPFDGGISLLVAAGVAYGVVRKKQESKDKLEISEE